MDGQLDTKPRPAGPGGQVEILTVKAAGQTFGLLLSQVHSILNRPWPAAAGLDWPLADLAGLLGLDAPAGPDGKIVLSGRPEPRGGLLVDEIGGVLRPGWSQLRALPGWLCRRRLGKLVWGAALPGPDQPPVILLDLSLWQPPAAGRHSSL